MVKQFQKVGGNIIWTRSLVLLRAFESRQQWSGRQAVAQLQWRVGELGALVGDDLEQVAWGLQMEVTIK